MTDPVNSVAGRTGNVVLTINDIVGFNNSNFANTAYVDMQLNAIVGGAPGALQTLANLANALNDGSNIASVIINDITLLQANDAAQSSNIHTLQGQVSALTTSTAVVSGRVSALEVANTIQSACLSVLNSTVSSILSGTSQFQDLIASGNGIYNLGSFTNQFKYGYFSEKIFLGSHYLTVDYYGNLRLDGHLVGTGGAGAGGSFLTNSSATMTLTSSGNLTFTDGTTLTVANGNVLVNGNVIQGGGGADLGNFTFDADRLYDINAFTIENSDASHGYTSRLAIPSNGSGDAELVNFYGNVYVTSGFNNGSTKTWEFGRDGTLTIPNGGKLGGLQYPDGIDLYASGTMSYAQVNFNNTNYIYTDSGVSALQTPNAYVTASTIENRVIVQATNPSLSQDSTWTFYSNGAALFPSNALLAPINTEFSVQTQTVDTDDNHLNLNSKSVDLYAYNSGADSWAELLLTNTTTTSPTANIYIKRQGGTQVNWAFDSKGNLTFPAGATIGQTTSNTAIFTAASGKVLELQSSANNNKVQVADNMISIMMGDSHWHFDNYGQLTLPSGANIISYGAGVTTIRDDNGVVISKDGLNAFSVTDATGVRILSNGYIWNFNTDASTTLPGNLVINGNLTVNGNVNYISVNNVVIGDNIINLADLNPADSLDLGFAAHRTPFGQPLQHTGLVRQASTNSWKLFSNVVPAPGTTVDFTYAIYDDLQVGNITSPTITGINANVTAANVGIIGYIDRANTIQSAQVGAANLAITAANVGMKGYVDSVANYSNINVASYLLGNIGVGTLNVSNLVVKGTIPTSNVGKQGDKAGQITVGNNYVYICTIDYPAQNSYFVTSIDSGTSVNFTSNVLVGDFPSYITAGWTLTSAYLGVTRTILQVRNSGGYANFLLDNSIAQPYSVYELNPPNPNPIWASIPLETFQTSANVAMKGYVDSQSFYSNAKVATYLQAGNISNVSVAGNVTATYFVGNGALLTGIAASSNYSNVQVATYLPTYSGNIANIRLGVSGVLTFPDGTTQTTAATGGGSSYSNVNVAAYLNTQGYNLYSNVNVAAYLTTGLSSNIVVGTGAYFVGNVSATTTMQYGAGQGGLLFTKLVGGTGAAIYNLNVTPSAQNYALSTNGAALNLNAPTGGGVYTSINNSIVTTVTAGYLNVAGNVSAANVSASYVNVTGNISAANVSAQYLFGDGSNLTNMYSNVNVANYLPSHTGNVGVNYILGTTPNVTLTAGSFNSVFDTLGNVSMPNVYVSGNVVSSYFVGNGAFLTGLPAGFSNVQVAAYLNATGYNLYSNANVASYLPLYGGDISARNITVSGNISLTGNILQINSAIFYGNTITGFSALYAGIPGYTPIPQVVAQFTENFNGYAQINSQNLNLGNQSSTDFVATANNGSDSAYFVDLGIAGGGYDPAVAANNNAIGTALYANDAYLYTAGNTAVNTGGNLVIGVQTLNKNIKFFAGGVNANNVVLTIQGNGITTAGNVTGTYFIGSGQFLTGLPTAYSNVNVQAYTESMGFQNYGNVNVSALITTNGLTNYSNVNTAAYLNSQGYNLYSNVNVIAYLAGNITVGNITATYFTGNGAFLTGLPAGYSNVQTAAYLNATGYNLYSNVNVAAYLSTATINTTGNITAAYISGNISVTGNVTGTSPNVTIQAGVYTSVFDNQGNVTVPRLFANGNIQSTGYIFGNGAFLTGVVTGSSYSNVQVATYLPTYSGNIANIRLGASGVLTFADGTTQTTAGGGSYSNVQVATYLPTYTGVVTASNVAVNGNVTAQYLFGNGSQLTGIAGNYSNVQVATYLPLYGGAIQSSNVQTTSANIQTTTAATNTATGALRVMGGVGVGGALFAAQLNSTGNLIANAISAYSINTVANVVASVVNAGTINSSGNVLAQNLTGTLTTASQTAITAVGTLATLSVTGNATVGNLVGSEANTRIIANAYVTTFDIFGNVTFPGNVIATRFIGDGSLLTNIAGGSSNYSNINVTAYLAGNITTGNITTVGNVNANYFVGTHVGNSVGTTATYTGNVTVGNLSVTGNLSANLLSITANSITGTSTNTTITAGSYTSTFDNAGNVILPNVYVSGGATVVGTVNSNGGTNGTAFAVRGSGAVSNVALGYFPPAGTAAQMAIRDYSTANSTMYFDTTVASGNVGGNFQFRGSSSYTQYAQIDRFGITLPTRPAFRVNGSAGPAQTTSNVNLKSPQTSVVFNQGNYYNDTTGQFTAPVAGLYAVGLNARVNTTGTSQIAVLKNGNNSSGNIVCFWETTSNSGTATHFGVNGTILLAVGDYLSANILLGTITFDGNDNWHVTYIG